MGTKWWSMPTLLANPRSRPETPLILVHLPQPLAQPRQDQEETDQRRVLLADQIEGHTARRLIAVLAEQIIFIG